MKPTRLALVVPGFAFLAFACTTDYQLGKDDPSFGDPNALAGQRPPEPFGAGASSSGGGSGPLCVRNGGTLVQSENCNVSLKETLLPEFEKAGCTSTACHGGTTPFAPPRIDPSDPAGMWEEWQRFKLSNGKLYINPCSTDLAESTIACNVNPTNTCGSPMPKGTSGLAPNVVQIIETWVQCGAPNN